MWVYPKRRYYEGLHELPPVERTDSDIKAEVVDRLRVNPRTRDLILRLDVKRQVVILDGEAPSTLAKRAAGDDAWDTPGVADVSNLLTVSAGRPAANERRRRPEPIDRIVVKAPTATPGVRVRDVMTSDPWTVRADSTVAATARITRDADIGAVIVEDEDGTIAGILTDRDIVVRGVAEERDLEAMPVAEAASAHLVTVHPDDTVAVSATAMRHRAVRRVPVVQDDRAVGTVALGDLAVETDPGSVLADISRTAHNT